MRFFSYNLKKMVEIPDESLYFNNIKDGRMLAVGIHDGVRVTKKISKEQYDKLIKKIGDNPKTRRSEVIMSNRLLFSSVLGACKVERRIIIDKGFDTKELDAIINTLEWILNKYMKYNGDIKEARQNGDKKERVCEVPK